MLHSGRFQQVSTHSRPKAAGCDVLVDSVFSGSFNTQPPEGGWKQTTTQMRATAVSTHSRPKAAGVLKLLPIQLIFGFNTQPPEGGWVTLVIAFNGLLRFNTQPPEGGW